MKKKSLISIFVLIISMLACGLVFVNNKITPAAAAEAEVICYNLIGQDGEFYLAKNAVGKVVGGGEFIIGSNNAQLSAVAFENFQIRGWRVTYNEQSGTTQDIDMEGLTAGSKVVALNTKEGGIVDASVSYVVKDNICQSSTFKLDTVFEDIKVEPIIDTIYYKVDITSMVDISKSLNTLAIGEDTLYYLSSSESEGVTTYVGSFIKTGGQYFYYGNLKEKSGKYYTLHNTYAENPVQEEIEYTVGSHRINDEVQIHLDVNVNTADIYNSSNVDVVGVGVVGVDSVNLALNKNATAVANSYKVTKDSLRRTTDCDINFNVADSKNQINKVQLQYHNLYVVDVILKVDGSATHSEHADIFGDVTAGNYDVESNIDFRNFYSRVAIDNTQFLAKNSADNNAKSFGVTCARSITKVVDKVNYEYYQFASLDGTANAAKYYDNFEDNIVVEIGYNATQHEIAFACVEYLKDKQGTVNLVEMTGNVLAPVYKKRGERLELTLDSANNIENIGYRLVGYTNSLKGNVVENYSYLLDSNKPAGTTIYMCFEKVEYNIVFTNYNTKSIDGAYPLSAINFTLTNPDGVISETFNSADLVGTYIALQAKLKITGTLTIADIVNTGFEVLGYSLKNPADDYLTEKSFTIDEEFINKYCATYDIYTYNEDTWGDDWTRLYIANAYGYELNASEVYDSDVTYYEKTNLDTITLYVYEEYVRYTLTYITDATRDSALGADVIMAEIDAVCAGATIEKYDVAGLLICPENSNEAADVAKIIISNLKYKDQVKLISVGLDVDNGTDSYSYAFNWYTEDGKSTLPYTFSSGEYIFTETVQRSRTIKVVYSMPSTKLFITLSEEFAQLEAEGKLTYLYQIERQGQPIEAVGAEGKEFEVDVGIILDVRIANVAFGYSFIGYTVIETSKFVAAGTTFAYETVNGVNTLRLEFERVEYHFVFSQYGAERVGLADGTKIKFNIDNEDKEYAILDIDHTVLTIEKPLGYYVSDVLFAGNFKGYSEELRENNNMRNDADILNYVFNLSREAFEVLVAEYSSEKEVQVRLDYRLFTYRVQVNYGLINPKGDNRDSYVTYPNMKLDYVFDGNAAEATKDPTAPTNVLIFQNIPYGATAKLNLLTGAPMGFSFTGWYYVNNNLVTDRLASVKELNVGSVVKDQTQNDAFVYTLGYNTYNVVVNYNSDQGSPEVKINNVVMNGTNKYISMYDNLEIAANASRNAGYGFNNITYLKPIYTEYPYSEETWDLYKETLYVLIDGLYEKNVSALYDSNKKYFIYDEEEVVVYDHTLSINEITIGDYALSEDKQNITFNVNYKLIDLSIKNTFYQFTDVGYWSIIGDFAGNPIGDIKFDLQEFANITMLAKYKEDQEREVEATDSVNFYDTVRVRIAINQAARNFNGDVYDLTKGLSLYEIKIGDKPFGFNSVVGETGVYEFSFNVGQVFPMAGEEINVSYTFKVVGKDVEVTTIVQESATFYKNITMHIDAQRHGFEPSDYYSYETQSIAQSLQFLAKATLYAAFTTPEYSQNFEISGVIIYCDGREISESERGAYGIEIDEDTMSVTARAMHSVKAVLIVQPIITFNGGPAFTKTFACNELGIGIAQKLTVGATTEADIQMAEILVDAVTITYKSTAANSVIVNDVTNVGVYNVFISFANTAELDWLNEVQLAENVKLTIQPKKIYVVYNEEEIVQVKKIYDGTSDYNVANIYSYLKFTDNNAFNINYKDVMASAGNNLALNSTAACYIATVGKDTQIELANETVYYNLYVFNLELKSNMFNNNFNLQNTDLVIFNYVQIAKRKLNLQNLEVQSKVYDETDKATLGNTDKITITNVIAGDEVVIDTTKLNPKFENANIGTNKKVILDASTALSGADVSNYYISTIETQGVTIYPYSLKAEIVGLGTVEVMNKRGLEDVEKVGLIPINATLNVVPIYFESQQFVSIYNRINQYLKGNNEFAIGYSVSFIVNGENVPINRELYLSVPQVKNMTGAYYLTGVQTGKVNPSYEAGNLIVDLSQMGEDFDKLILVKTKYLLEVWQIILIVIGVLLLVAGGVLTFFIIRKRKINRDSIHEKI